MNFHINLSTSTFASLREKKKKKGNPRRKAILFVAKLTNSTMHLSFTFGDMKFKKYINFNYPAGNMDT